MGRFVFKIYERIEIYLKQQNICLLQTNVTYIWLHKFERKMLVHNYSNKEKENIKIGSNK